MDPLSLLLQGTPTPENFWNGAGAPSPGMEGYLDAMLPSGRADAQWQMSAHPPPGPPEAATAEEEQAQRAGLEAMGYHPMMVQASWDPTRGGWYDDTGQNNLVGQPNENGQAAAYVDQFNKGAPPQSHGLGPFYGPSGVFSGTPLNPGDQLQFGGDAIASNWQDFENRDTSTGGGFWTMDDVFGSRSQDVPPVFQSGSGLPSTNNYRLLGGGYNQPNFIMRNGQIIDLSHPWLTHPFGNILQTYAGGANARQPAAVGPAVSPDYNYTAQGWPGSVTGWNATPYRQG